MAIELNGTTGITTPDINTTAQSTDITTTGDISAVDVTASGGVYLGGTAAANYLDDYEEGTWTATLTNLGTATSNNVTASYRKIGKVVFLYLPYKTYTNGVGSGSSDITLTLPFTVAAGANGSAALGMQTGGPASNSQHMNVYFVGNTTSALFYSDYLTTWDRKIGADIAGNWAFGGSVFYITA